jgi:hypothetical protein
MARPLAPFAVLLALSVLLAFGHELARGGGRQQLVESVTGTVSGQALALLGGGWVLLPTTRLALTALSTALAAAMGARLLALVPVPRSFAGWTAVAGGVAAGTAAAAVLDPSRLVSLFLVATVVAAVVAGLDRLILRVLPRAGATAVLAAGAAPLLAVGTAAYAAARLVS